MVPVIKNLLGKMGRPKKNSPSVAPAAPALGLPSVIPELSNKLNADNPNLNLSSLSGLLKVYPTPSRNMLMASSSILFTSSVNFLPV